MSDLRKWRVSAADRYLGWFGLHLSLTFKIFLPVLVTTAVMAGTVGWIVTGQVAVQVEGAYDQEAASTFSGVAAMYAVDSSNVGAVNSYLADVQKGTPDFKSIRIVNLDPAATVIASTRPEEVGRGGFLDSTELRAVLSGSPLQEIEPNGDLTIVHPLSGTSPVRGAVVIVSSRADEQLATRTILTTIGIAALASVILESIFVLSALYLGIIRRTRRMQRAVDAVAAGDTSMRLPEGEEPRGRDEIFNLARSIDHMILGLDEGQRGDALIRHLGQRAMQAAPTAELIAEALSETRQALGLESCLFAEVNEDGSMGSWIDGSRGRQTPRDLPVWVFALSRVAVEARRTVITDRLGRNSRFAETGRLAATAQAAIVPLPRPAKAGHAIVAIAPAGESIGDRGLAVLDSVAATIAESLQMQAAETARAESAVKSRVMAAVSHEMRNPLNSILGFTKLVLGSPNSSLNDKERRQLGYVQSSANNMLGLVNNYLDLAKARSGALSLQMENVRLAALVGEVCATMQPLADAKKLTLRWAVAEDDEARVDPVRLRQVLNNLISNAIKFTPESGRVLVRARALRGGCRIAVSDTGVGIKKDEKELIFTEFAKIDAGSMATSRGTGLGLPLTRAFVVAMGGTIRVYSRRGRGTTFVVILSGDSEARRGTAA